MKFHLKFFLLHFWRLEVYKQGVGWAVVLLRFWVESFLSLLRFRGQLAILKALWLAAALVPLCLHLHIMAFSLCLCIIFLLWASVSKFPLFVRLQLILDWPHLQNNDLILTSINLQRLWSQIRSQSEVLEIRTWFYGGQNSVCNIR